MGKSKNTREILDTKPVLVLDNIILEHSPHSVFVDRVRGSKYQCGFTNFPHLLPHLSDHCGE